MMKKLIIDLNNYESAKAIEKTALWWNEEMDGDIKINRYGKMRLLPCTFKHLVDEAELPEFEKKRLMKDGLVQLLDFIKNDPDHSIYYTKNYEAIVELSFGNRELYKKYFDKIPKEDFLSARLLDYALAFESQ